MMDEQFSKRRAGEGDVYETEIARPEDGKRIPVSVTGIPIMDDDDRCVGALGIIRNLEREKIAEAIHNHLETQRDEVKLVELVAQELDKLVPFDLFGVSQYSRDLEHVSSWIRYTRGEKVKISRRWWPIPAHLKAQLRQPILVPDYLLYLRENALENYLKETSVKKFLDQGFKSFLRIPITERERVIASVILFSKENAKYSRAHIDQIKGLRVEQAIHLAIYYRNKRKFQFRSNLIKEMIKLSTAKELASLLAIRLAEQYEWHHVAIFKVCKPEKKFRLLAEAATEGASSLPKNLRERSIRIGILGHVYKSRQPVSIPDVSSDELSKAFVAGWPDIHSELCLPIVWDDKVQWLLNVEDQRVQAFSKDEQQEVSVILEEAALLLQRLSRQHLLESAFQSSSDAVLITDSQKTILDANPAAAKLLGYKSSKRLRGAFKRLFKDAQVARGLLSAERTLGMEVDLVRSDGTNVPVLISGVDLSDDISRKVFVAKNLTSRRRLERLEELKKLFQEVALQTHTPLALANCWLERLSRFTADHDTVEFIPKILGQLKKLEISYDRLALLTADFNAALATSRKQPLDIAVEIKRIIEEFPISESRQIDFADPGELPYVNCDPVQISFVFASILSYLIRFSPSKKPIDIRFTCMEKTISVIISGLLPPKSGESEAERNVARTRFEMALGEPVIEAFAKNNSAKYERRETDGEDARFKIDFDLTAQESTG